MARSFSMTATLSFMPSTAEAAAEMRNRSPSRTFLLGLEQHVGLAVGERPASTAARTRSSCSSRVADRLALLACRPGTRRPAGRRRRRPSARTAESASSGATWLAAGRSISGQRHGDERHEKVDVHHEHQIDHRRDVELGRLADAAWRAMSSSKPVLPSAQVAAASTAESSLRCGSS